MKILRKQEQTAQFEKLSKEVGEVYTAAVHEAHRANCLQWLKGCPDGEYDVILTDPPYGMGADTFGDSDGCGATNEHTYDDSYEAWRALMLAWCPESYRVTKTQAHAYIFCDIQNYFELKAMMEATGWYVFRTPLIRTKPGVSGRVPLPLEGPRRQWESILYAIKGHKPVLSIQSDVIVAEMDDMYSHGAVKPVNLYRQLLERSCRPGDTVLDTFAGSGPIFPAGHALKLKVTGIEMEEKYYGMCLKRLDNLSNQSFEMHLHDEADAGLKELLAASK